MVSLWQGSRAGLVVAVVLGLSTTAAASAYSRVDDRPQVVFTIEAGQITESSALVVSTVHPDLVYTSNDSGDTATVYVLEVSSGELVGQTTIGGADAVDIEALAGGSDGSLVVADIGDNDAERSAVAIYRIDQPARGSGTVNADRVSMTYSDGPRDAESVLYDADSGRVLVVSKEFTGAHIYRSPPDVFDRSTAVLRPVARAPGVATDATFLPNEDFAIIRNYIAATVYRYPRWQRVRSVSLPPQRQGESVAAPPGNREIWVGSEGSRSEVLAVALPDLTPGPPTAQPPTPAPVTQTVESVQQGRLRSAAWIIVFGATAALVLVIAVGVVRYRRHRQEHP